MSGRAPNVPTLRLTLGHRRGDVERLLDELSGGWPWVCWDRGLSSLLDLAVVLEEEAAA
jgi:hypothetical protein